MATVPLKFSTFLQTRDGTSTTKDARITNLIVEPISEDETHFLKRPGYSIYDGTGWASQAALGSTTLPDGTIISFIGNPYGGTNNATMNITSGYNPYVQFSSSLLNHATLSVSGLTVNGDGFSANLATAQVSNFKSTGKLYYEAFPLGDTYFVVGLAQADYVNTNYVGISGHSIGYFQDGRIYVNSSNTTTVATYTIGDCISVAYNADARTLTMYKNGVSVGVLASGLTGAYSPAVNVWQVGGGQMRCNFGNSPWHYPPPAGFTGWLP